MIKLESDEYWNYHGTVYTGRHERIDVIFACKTLSKNKFLKTLCKIQEFSSYISYAWCYERCGKGSNDKTCKNFDRFKEPILIYDWRDSSEVLATVDEDGKLHWLVSELQSFTGVD